ncbi:Fimbrial assembly family protein [Ammonifex degensii KC4]|uniref:Fimbrial assembly family protein n=1 Tax=Ammonifex degensii (strain DSM 10501 / KC4) TaxID=429009 RepID=C9R930_AMMDK|nr:PilN domain-containing protein [Ammonifex degensii]ACX52809.1 Fimbrial assembly family protein [Ammonifex degensii KC4]
MNYKVNLLPPRLQVEGLVDKRRLLILVSTLLGGGGLVLGYGAFLLNFLLTKSELARTQQELSRLRPQVQAVEAIHTERVRLEKALKEYADIVHARRSWHSILKGIGDVCPADISLTVLEVVPAEKTQAGKASSKAELPPPASVVNIQGVSQSFTAIGVFERKLWESGYFQEVRLEKVSTDKSGLYAFTMQARLKEGMAK